MPPRPDSTSDPRSLATLEVHTPVVSEVIAPASVDSGSAQVGSSRGTVPPNDRPPQDGTALAGPPIAAQPATAPEGPTSTDADSEETVSLPSAGEGTPLAQDPAPPAISMAAVALVDSAAAGVTPEDERGATASATSSATSARREPSGRLARDPAKGALGPVGPAAGASSNEVSAPGQESRSAASLPHPSVSEPKLPDAVPSGAALHEKDAQGEAHPAPSRTNKVGEATPDKGTRFSSEASAASKPMAADGTGVVPLTEGSATARHPDGRLPAFVNGSPDSAKATSVGFARQQAIASIVSAANHAVIQRVASGSLEVPELGRVAVRATSDGKQVDIEVAAERVDARTLLHGSAQAMAADLREAAIPVRHLRFGDADTGGLPSGMASGHQGPGSGARDHAPSARKESEPATETAPLPSARRGTVRIVL